jgi:hypothetical protein
MNVMERLMHAYGKMRPVEVSAGSRKVGGRRMMEEVN